jgi:hypothetical protein
LFEGFVEVLFAARERGGFVWGFLGGAAESASSSLEDARFIFAD